MPRPRDRMAATEQRKRAIRRAALACFVARGYEQTTMADIRRRAGASTGSIYHHFKSKEQLAADLYLEGVRAAQEASLGAMLRCRSAERGVRALVRAYLEWVQANPDHARFLLSAQRTEFLRTSEAALAELNTESGARVAAWIEPHIARGDLPALDMDLYRALLTGPSDFFARQWLAGRTRTPLDRAAARLADAAWAALQRLTPRQREKTFD